MDDGQVRIDIPKDLEKLSIPPEDEMIDYF